MRNYVIINGVNSLTINGLAINELPPISKPPMRTLQEEIDGRDGDIITNLGYGSYDKIMTIGLYNGYDIDEIIAFFNGEGTIIFSNEPDKYYNYKIIEQIDYESLIKFRTATVTFHCQPFKYPVEEEPIEVDYDYIEEEGEDLTLEPTDGSPLSLTLKGNTSQYTTTGKNLLPNDKATDTATGITITKNDDGTYKVNGTATADVSLAINDNFISMSGTWRMVGCPSGGSASTYMLSAYVGYWGEGSPNIDTGSGTNITYTGNVKVRFYIKSGTTCNNLIFKPMITTDTSATYDDFEPYTNGASPNPSNPQPVNVVTGDNEVKVVGKNLFDKSSTPIYYSQSMQYTETDTGCKLKTSSSGSGFVLIDLGDIKNYENKTLTFSMSNTANALYKYIAFIGCDDVGENRLTIGSALGSSSNTLTATIGSNYTQTRLTIRLYIDGGTANTDYELNNIMVETNNQATTYTPYQSQTYPIYLGVENLLDNIATTQTISDVTFTKNEDGTMLVNGTASADVSLKITDYLTFSSGNYILSGCPSGGSNATYSMVLEGTGRDTGDSVSFTSATNKRVAIEVKNGTTCNNLLFKPMIEKGTKLNHYTPYGTTPIELCKIGDYQDEILKSTGKNLFNIDDTSASKGYYLTSSGVEDISGNWSVYYVPVQPNTTYTISGCQTNSGAFFGWFDSNKTFISNIGQKQNRTITSPSNAKYLGLSIVWNTTSSAYDSQFMLNTGTTALPYEPYGTQWYLHKEIGKVVLDGSETWYRWTANTFYITKFTEIRNALSNYYTYNTNATGAGQLNNGEFFIHDSLNNYVVIFKNTGINDSIDSFKTWLSTHNTIVYYVLNTPTNTEITDTTLISQLDNIQGAMSYTGQTNIMQVPYDKPFIIKARTMEGGSDEAIINNIGNTYAKPTIDIEGNGIVNVYLNGNQIFAVNVTDEVVIDSTNLEAYNPNTSALENRKVTGNIANLKLNTGTSILKFSGNLTKATITDYVRYL